MLTNLKINSAIVICVAFIFRVLFVNIGIISSLSAQQNKGAIKSHFSSTMKRRKIVETTANPITAENSPMELCEGESNEENQLKSTPLVLIQILYSFFSNNLKTGLEKTYSFFAYSTFSSSPRFIAFQVFRV
ncbi:hypothetical protein [Aurantibacillus circumpalustris]|uniref:hypothetical protein n=1 Tax=Aurantibacillus circumpalustris TaxID=3036359 RepID=UPI00295ACCAD|nr:hypothetical protein [Aurantibacillus circumpalustris]